MQKQGQGRWQGAWAGTEARIGSIWSRGREWGKGHGTWVGAWQSKDRGKGQKHTGQTEAGAGAWGGAKHRIWDMGMGRDRGRDRNIK